MMKPTVTFHNFVNTPKNNTAVIYHGPRTILIPSKYTTYSCALHTGTESS